MNGAEVKERIWELEAESSGKDMSPICFCSTTSEYIVKKREVRPYSDFAGFCIDDDDAFIECITKANSSKIYGYIISLFYYLNQKFGCEVKSEARFDFYDILGWDSDPISIKELYGKNVAACTERASFAHNVLKILGYNATLVIGYLSINMQKEGHCYNLICLKSGINILLDTSSWVVIHKKDSLDFDYLIYPVIARLSDSEYAGFFKGEIYYLDGKNLVLPKDFTPVNEIRRFYS